MILLDTQSVHWLLYDKRLLSETAAEALRSALLQGGTLSIASTTLWEAAMLADKGRFPLRGSTADYVNAIERSFTVLPITGAIAVRSLTFSDKYPKDPADRIIGATAVVHGLRLVTSDKKIRRSGEVECVW